MASSARSWRSAIVSLSSSSAVSICPSGLRWPFSARWCRSADLPLQLQDAVEQRLGGRRAAGHVDVHRHDPVAAPHHRIAEVVVAAAVGAGPHGDHVARLGHLVVDLAERRRHLVGQRPGHDHQVRLPRARARRRAEPLEVVARHRGVHHLDRAAGEPEGHPVQAAGARPVDRRRRRGDEKALVGQLVRQRPRSSGRCTCAPGRRGRLTSPPTRPGLGVGDVGVYSHSSAPFFHS